MLSIFKTKKDENQKSSSNNKGLLEKAFTPEEIAEKKENFRKLFDILTACQTLMGKTNQLGQVQYLDKSFEPLAASAETFMNEPISKNFKVFLETLKARQEQKKPAALGASYKEIEEAARQFFESVPQVKNSQKPKK